MTENSEYIQIHCPNDLKGKPISGDPESPIQHLGNLTEILLKSLVHTFKIYTKDDWDF